MTTTSAIAEGEVSPPAGRRLPPLGRAAKAGYAVGAVLDGMSAQAVGLFLFFYVTAVCGLSGALAGIALAVGLIVDAVVDPLIGSLSDGWRSRLGRRLPFMLVGLPCAVVFLVLIFSLPRGLGGTGLFLWLCLVSIGLRVSLSLFILPYNAVGAELSDGHAERSSIAAWRWTFQMLGSVAAVVLGFGVFLAGEGGLSRRSAYTPFALTAGALIVVAALATCHSVYRTCDRQHAPPVHSVAIGGRFLKEVLEIFRNQSFRTLFLGALLLFSALAIHGTLAIHANTYFWGLSAGRIQAVTLALFGGLLCGAPLAAPMLRVMEKRTVLCIGQVGLALAFAGPVALRLAGLLPLTGSSLVVVLAASVFTGGMLMAAAAIAFSSMMADAADEHEYIFGARREGLYYAGWSFALKAAAGLGSLVAGVGLQLIGFPTGAGAHPVVGSVSSGTVEMLGALQGLGGGALALGAAATCMLYRLDFGKHAAIMRELDRRRVPEPATFSSVLKA